MRLRLSVNAAGDVRVQTLPDAPDNRGQRGARERPLVRTSKLQEMTTPPKPAYRVGFGRISSRNHFTKAARTRLRESAAVLEETGRARCVFLTGTLPGSTPASLRALAAWSGWVVQTIQQWVADCIGSRRMFGVWEYQRRGALHLHLCVQAETTHQADELRRRWKSRWIRVLRGVMARSGADVFARKKGGTWLNTPWVTRVDAQPVHKSVGSYLGKYLSKGSSKARCRAVYPPSHWSFVSRQVVQEVQSKRSRIEVEHLCLSDCLVLWEKAAAAVAVQTAKTYSYRNHFDNRCKAIISLCAPLQGWMVFRELATVLRALQGARRTSWGHLPVPLADVAVMFAGHLLVPNSS